MGCYRRGAAFVAVSDRTTLLIEAGHWGEGSVAAGCQQCVWRDGGAPAAALARFVRQGGTVERVGNGERSRRQVRVVRVGWSVGRQAVAVVSRRMRDGPYDTSQQREGLSMRGVRRA
eukprot:5123915-Prymnesium_polylepis.1